MVRTEDILALVERSSPYVLLLDGAGKILYASDVLLRACGKAAEAVAGQGVDSLGQAGLWDMMQSAMEKARVTGEAHVTFAPIGAPRAPMELRLLHVRGADGDVFLFQGTRGNGLGATQEWQKDERVKELSCVYAVAEWIEASSTVREFFEKLPDYLRPGMRYPEHAMVFSFYQGQEYGDRAAMTKYIKADLEIPQQPVGEIRVGYASDEFDLLPEEQRMLDEIARMLNVALERKTLRDKLALKQKEEAEFRERLRELEREIQTRTKEVDEQGQKLATVNSYLDRINRDWEESKVRLETIFQAIPDRVALIDRQRNVVMTNTESPHAGGKCFEAFFGNDAPCKDCRLSRITKMKTPVTLEVKHDDTYFEVNALPIFSPAHEVEGIIEFYRDITLEKTYEQQLQQADKLASLGQLVSGIGHEINNPNQFIRGNIKIIQQAFEGILPILDDYYAKNPDLKIARLKYDFFREHIMTLVNDMAHGSERIKEIVEGLKRFARKDEGLLIDSVDVNTIVDAAARLVHNQVHKHADIEFDLSPGLPVITGNSQKIEQVIINLLINAGQATPEDRRGVIRVSTGLDDGFVVIEVKDNGKGMSERTMKHIFEPFFTTRRAAGGTGLGLAIVYRIIEEHGGVISVQSRLDHGTTFKITLPVKQPAAGEKPPEEAR